MEMGEGDLPDVKLNGEVLKEGRLKDDKLVFNPAPQQIKRGINIFELYIDGKSILDLYDIRLWIKHS